MEAVLGSIHKCLPEGDGWRRQGAKQSSLIHHCDAKLARRKLGIIATEKVCPLHLPLLQKSTINYEYTPIICRMGFGGKGLFIHACVAKRDIM